eukprot:Platyproteum_vivax@DN7044_c0_g1_i2.p1
MFFMTNVLMVFYLVFAFVVFAKFVDWSRTMHKNSPLPRYAIAKELNSLYSDTQINRYQKEILVRLYEQHKFDHESRNNFVKGASFMQTLEKRSSPTKSDSKKAKFSKSVEKIDKTGDKPDTTVPSVSVERPATKSGDKALKKGKPADKQKAKPKPAPVIDGPVLLPQLSQTSTDHDEEANLPSFLNRVKDRVSSAVPSHQNGPLFVPPSGPISKNHVKPGPSLADFELENPRKETTVPKKKKPRPKASGSRGPVNVILEENKLKSESAHSSHKKTDKNDEGGPVANVTLKPEDTGGGYPLKVKKPEPVVKRKEVKIPERVVEEEKENKKPSEEVIIPDRAAEDEEEEKEPSEEVIIPDVVAEDEEEEPVAKQQAKSEKGVLPQEKTATVRFGANTVVKQDEIPINDPTTSSIMPKSILKNVPLGNLTKERQDMDDDDEDDDEDDEEENKVAVPPRPEILEIRAQLSEKHKLKESADAEVRRRANILEREREDNEDRKMTHHAALPHTTQEKKDIFKSDAEKMKVASLQDRKTDTTDTTDEVAKDKKAKPNYGVSNKLDTVLVVACCLLFLAQHT